MMQVEEVRARAEFYKSSRSVVRSAKKLYEDSLRDLYVSRIAGDFGLDKNNQSVIDMANSIAAGGYSWAGFRLVFDEKLGRWAKAVRSKDSLTVAESMMDIMLDTESLSKIKKDWSK